MSKVTGTITRLGVKGTITQSGAYNWDYYWLSRFVSDLALSQTDDDVILTWNNNGTVDWDYTIIERKLSGGDYAQIAQITKTLETYTDENFTVEGTYYYRIRLIKGTHYSDYCTAVSIAISLAPDGSPSLLTATVDSDTAITLNWTIGSTNQDGHRIYISTDGVNYALKGTVTGSTATYSATGLTPYTKYYFYVVAYKGGMESPASDVVNGSTYQNLYVRPLGGSYGEEDGTSYDNAFDGFAGINWASVTANTILWICGTHNETLAVGATGTISQHLIFRGDYPNDPGVIDGQDTRDFCVYIETNSKYTEWRNLLLTQSIKTCINFGSSQHWMYDCVITDSGDQNVEVGTTYGVYLTRCTISGAADDGVSLHHGKVYIYDCDFTLNGSNIQGVSGSVFEMYDSRVVSGGSVQSDLPCIIQRCYFKNSNVIIESYSGVISYSLFDVRENPGIRAITGGHSLQFINCTIVGNGGGDFRVFNTYTLSFINCIFYKLTRVGYIYEGGILNFTNSDRYLIAIEDQTTDVNPIVGDPLFTDITGNDFTLQSGSPCRGAGVTGLGYTKDYAGNPVPLTDVDLGCYQSQT